MDEQRSGFRKSAVSDLMTVNAMTASEFAHQIGVSPQAVSEYRKGQKTPQLATVLKMADAFDRPLEFFVERVAEPSARTA